MRIFTLCAVLAMVMMLGSACVPKSNKTSGATLFSNRTLNVSGQVMVKQRLMLPPETTLKADLIALNEADPEKRVLNTMTYNMGATNPYPFTITYNEGTLDTDGKYGLMLRVMVNGETRFMTSAPLEVISNGKWDLGEIVLDTGSR